jgi:hypothetical protein
MTTPGTTSAVRDYLQRGYARNIYEAEALAEVAIEADRAELERQGYVIVKRDENVAELWRQLDMDSGGLLADAMDVFYTEAKTRRPAIEAWLRKVKDWHDHDQEDEHCTSECPSWFDGAFCFSCGEAHLVDAVLGKEGES